MKIREVRAGVSPLRKFQFQNIKNNSHSNTFASSNKPSFKASWVDKDWFDTGKSAEKLQEIAETFYLSEDWEIEEACNAEWTIDGKFYPEKAKIAYKNLMHFVKETREHAAEVNHYLYITSKLGLKLEDNIGESENNISQTLFKMFKIEQEGHEIPPNNGVLVYGDACDKAKEDFVQWFKENVPANFKECDYDPLSPQESMEKIIEIAKDAQKTFEATGKRTVLQIKGIDRLLTLYASEKYKKTNAKFKSFAQNCSTKYHTTLLLKTNFNIDELDSASIAPHRFENRLFLISKAGIYKDYLKNLMSDKERLEKAVSKKNKVFRCDTVKMVEKSVESTDEFAEWLLELKLESEKSNSKG